MKDYYSLLGIDKKATKLQIKKNYRTLATKFHPDKNSDPDAAAKFIIITEAYDVLSNRKSRAKYDLMIWEKLKRSQESSDTFTTVAPPRESLRTRRNKAQQKRSIKYRQAKSKFESTWRLGVESLFILSRYIYHILGLCLGIVILNSAASQLSDVFQSGIGMGIVIGVLIAVLVYGLIKIVQHVYEEFKKDIEAFSIFYKQPQRTLALLVISISVIFLLLILTVWKVF